MTLLCTALLILWDILAGLPRLVRGAWWWLSLAVRAAWLLAVLAVLMLVYAPHRDDREQLANGEWPAGATK